MPEQVLHLANLRDGYVDLVRWVQNNGQPVAPRDQGTVEIEGGLVVLHDPFDSLPLGTGRGISKGIAAVEACQLLGGVSMPKLVVAIGPIFDNYREDNGEFHGAYGPRTRGQFEVMIERLKADPDSRQAITTIWSSNYDLAENKRDYPCTLSFTFHIRDNRLNMRVHMRSNDVIKGVAYDFFQFTRVQIAMASVLGIEPGRYVHYADSLHLYDRDQALVEKLHYPTVEEQQVFTRPPFFGSDSWAQVRQDALDCLEVAETDDDQLQITAAQAWYAAAMINAMRRNQRQRAHV